MEEVLPSIIMGHGYVEGPTKPMGEALPKPDTTSRLVVVAISELVRRGHAASVFFSANIKSPTVGEMMNQQLHRNLGLHTPPITYTPTGDSTRNEAVALRNYVNENNLQNTSLIVVGEAAHMRRIVRAHRRAFARKQFRKIQFLSAEEILTSERYRDVVTNFTSSDAYHKFVRIEQLRNFLDIPFDGAFLRIGRRVLGNDRVTRMVEHISR